MSKQPFVASAPALGHRLRDAISARVPLLDEAHETALRLFSGFSEGHPHLAIDLYGSTVVIHNHADPPELAATATEVALETVHDMFPWVHTAIVKRRNSNAPDDRRGVLALGDRPDDRVREGTLLFALDLRLHQDCSLYLDTRGVRNWATQNLGGTTVLNAFAYTGALGVAALGGGAARVLQLDRSRLFLDIARRSLALNHFAIRRPDFRAADFFRETARLRREHELFDCVFLDPPFFASGPGGVVDQESASARLINKARPLVKHGGRLVAINNAVYVSGADYMRTLQALCGDGHMLIDELLPVPEDFVGMLRVTDAAPVTDPAPFNHSTKVAVLRMTM